MRLKILPILLILFFTNQLSFSACSNAEICISNNSSQVVFIQIYPVSVIFNSRFTNNLQISLNNNGVPCQWTSNSKRFDYINGVHRIYNENKELFVKFRLNPNDNMFLTVDHEKPCGPGLANRGYGKYKLEVIRLLPGDLEDCRDSCLIEYDFYNENQKPGDLEIIILEKSHDDITNPFIRYKFWLSNDINNYVNINYKNDNYKIQTWKPNGLNPYNSRNKNFETSNGPYKIANEVGFNVYNYFPLDCRILCNFSNVWPFIVEGQNHIFPLKKNEWDFIDNNIKELRQGDLSMNLEMTKSVSTYPLNNYYIGGFDLLKYMIPLTITQDATLIIDPNITYTCYCGDDNYIYPDFYFVVKQNGKLDLKLNSQIILNNKTHLFLEFASNLSTVFIDGQTTKPHILVNGGEFCNLGTIRQGRLWIRYNNHIYSQCSASLDNLIFNDSVKVQFADSCIYEIADNKSLIFEEPESELVLDSNSTVKLGNNASIIIRNGAKINALNAKFIPLNNNSVWNGIYIENAGINSIKNCLIENSLNGITVNNRITQFDDIPQSVEISGCNFKNSANSLLSNAIYVTNFNNILIKDNLFQSTNIPNGFSNGISLEYCPTGNINIIGNNINNSLTGINIVQTSPFVSRNQITGSINSNYGIFLDNSNGAIKNNNVNIFKNSICMYYSSPYLLKNNFNNATVSNLELNSNSFPFMQPLISGNNLNWISGNNNLIGYPTSCGISFNGESYPGIDNGYNITAVNGAYYIKGTLSSTLDGFLPGTFNNWQDEQPIVNNFLTDNGTVLFNPTFDGINVPGYDSYELSDLGFGLSDTLFIKDLNKSTGGEILFLQAYKHEKRGQFIQAISKYKQLLGDFKNSILAYNSLAHIFNCLEKSKSNHGQYISHQNYLTQIKNNIQYSKAIRELAEDFIIKSKLRCSNIDEAISDYNEIYIQNQNTPKGVHALINKESLISMKQDTTDGKSNPLRYKNHLLSAFNKIYLNKLNSGNIIPLQFEMFGNYPNPFNPQTNIKFGIPKKSFVTLKIYDVSGKEIETLVNGFIDAGYHTLIFNASKYSSGIYFYKLISEKNIFSGKMVLVK